MISSQQNPLIKQVKRLRQKKYRLREGVGFIEGLRGVLTAVEQRPDLIETILFAPDLLHSPAAKMMIEAQSSMQIRPISAELFRTISDRENPAGLGAIVRSPVQTLSQFTREPQGVYIALDHISDPGNLGTILRSVDASGADGVILVGNSTDATHPAALKASMGTAFTVPIAAAQNIDDLLVWSQQNRCHIIATTANTEQTYWATNYPRPVLLLMGNEQTGLSPQILEKADQQITIPMHGQASSLNLAIATSLILYEVLRTT